MKKELEIKNIPWGYELCFNDNCQQALLREQTGAEGLGLHRHLQERAPLPARVIMLEARGQALGLLTFKNLSG